MQKTPIERLACMNQPAIDIYKEHKIDLWKEPLEIAVCAQHNNGGFAVNQVVGIEYHSIRLSSAKWRGHTA